MITIVLNGQDREFSDEATVASILDFLGQGAQGVAVAVNDEVLPRSAWARTAVVEGDRVEVLTAARGG